MIRLSDTHIAPQIYEMWKICFDDTEAFVDLYFSEKFKNENTLVYLENGKAAASLQISSYQFSFFGAEIPIAYISGACTLPEYRKKGYMGKLLTEAFELMQKRNIPLSLLIPAEKWLYDYYSKYGYEKVFDGDKDEQIDLKKIIEKSKGDLDAAYNYFDAMYRNKDFCVQKTKADFECIVKDAELDKFPIKTNLSGMARVINAKCLLGIFAEKYPLKSLNIQLQDNNIQNNNTLFRIEGGKCKTNRDSVRTGSSVFVCDVNSLCRMLFGFRLNEISSELKNHFETQHAVMNLMLE